MRRSVEYERKSDDAPGAFWELGVAFDALMPILIGLAFLIGLIVVFLFASSPWD